MSEMRCGILIDGTSALDMSSIEVDRSSCCSEFTYLPTSSEFHSTSEMSGPREWLASRGAIVVESLGVRDAVFCPKHCDSGDWHGRMPLWASICSLSALAIFSSLVVLF